MHHLLMFELEPEWKILGLFCPHDIEILSGWYSILVQFQYSKKQLEHNKQYLFSIHFQPINTKVFMLQSSGFSSATL
jgi:hypothetical protein